MLVSVANAVFQNKIHFLISVRSSNIVSNLITFLTAVKSYRYNTLWNSFTIGESKKKIVREVEGSFLTYIV